MKMERKQERKDHGRKKASKYHVEVDTNIFEIALDCLDKKTEIATGDAELCSGCQAVFNHKSKIDEANNNQVWKCEFCNHANEVMLDEEEKPKTEAINYLIEAAS